MTIITTLPYTLTNGNEADASQVQANLDQIVDDVNENAASQADIADAGQVKLLSRIGQTSNGVSVTIPANSVCIGILVRETAGHTIVLTEATDDAYKILEDYSLSSHGLINSVSTFGGLGTHGYSTSVDIDITTTSANWNGASVDTLLYYVDIS